MYKPQFQITNNLLTYVARIEAAKSLIDMAPIVPAWEIKFRSSAINRMVHYGTKIEGNELTQEQANQIVRLKNINDSREVMKKSGILARDRDVQEVINYRNVVEWMDKQKDINENDVYTESTLKTLHRLTVEKIVDKKYVGVYRDKQVIVESGAAGGVVFRPPVSVEVPYLVRDLFSWGKLDKTKEIHPIFRAAILHYQLVYIHPFIEGNGRTARAMATLLMYATGYDFKRFFSLEQYFDSNINAYYEALLSVQQSKDHDLTYWLEYFVYGLAIEIEKIKSQVLKLSRDLRLKKQLGKQIALSERQIILLELFQQQDEITSEEAQRVLPNVSVDTILRDIKDLIKKGVVEKKGVTKGVSYRLVGS